MKWNPFGWIHLGFFLFFCFFYKNLYNSRIIRRCVRRCDATSPRGLLRLIDRCARPCRLRCQHKDSIPLLVNSLVCTLAKHTNFNPFAAARFCKKINVKGHLLEEYKTVSNYHCWYVNRETARISSMSTTLNDFDLALRWAQARLTCALRNAQGVEALRRYQT